MVLSVLGSVAASLMALVRLLKDMSLPKIIGVFLVLSFALGLAGIGLFTELKENGDENDSNLKAANYGWAYFIAWVGALIALVNGILHFVKGK